MGPRRLEPRSEDDQAKRANLGQCVHCAVHLTTITSTITSHRMRATSFRFLVYSEEGSRRRTVFFIGLPYVRMSKKDTSGMGAYSSTLDLFAIALFSGLVLMGVKGLWEVTSLADCLVTEAVDRVKQGQGLPVIGIDASRKRGRQVRTKPHHLTKPFQALILAFGFHIHTTSDAKQIRTASEIRATSDEC
ncbi:hypothetical protein CC1G_14706 [Coprinopsis cinerea okayama7|uniref:Uncharacterized protein n=1 Tax=Coprinopsis cinerea (strain Okayama-7 / 130 / ATCC MYA-4618 / FGSC 9003) TaxID=240176 RepID=D6RMT1_COPC7|nr:hypothetical protein CC1G_14706 [Coprinopsis cinerea okayama7\|eukprot:XP_002911277.1 hypothetical protein CC1G_14706 [Coprinopsis cinerea okayama7\